MCRQNFDDQLQHAMASMAGRAQDQVNMDGNNEGAEVQINRENLGEIIDSFVDGIDGYIGKLEEETQRVMRAERWIFVDKVNEYRFTCASDTGDEFDPGVAAREKLKNELSKLEEKVKNWLKRIKDMKKKLG